MKFSLQLCTCASLFVGVARAQDVLVVTDSTNDRIVTCVDTNADGDLNDAGEIVVLYDDVNGSFGLTNNVGITIGPGNVVFVSDTTEDIVLSLNDANADGDALDAGEATIYFDGRPGGNAQGVVMGSANSLYYDAATGKLWIATASVTGAFDEILVVQDSNSDGDANDLLESRSYWTAPVTTYLPQAVSVDAAGSVFYTENGTSVAKGVYQLKDLNSDGDAQDAGEQLPYFILPVTTPTPFIWSLEIDAQGWFYVADTGGDFTYRFKDLDLDGDANDSGEWTTFFTPVGTSTIWDVAATLCGTIYASDGLNPDRIYRWDDANGDGVIGAGEFAEIYNETGGNPVAIGNGRGIAVRSAPCGTPSTAFCFGDGSGTACPCANSGALGSGCANSTFSAGATLTASGIAGASIATDTLVLTASNVPGPGLFFQGTAPFAGGLGITFGDGLLCTGTMITRLGVVFPSGSSASYPGGLTPNPIHIAGATAVGDVRQYQCWYRDAAVFCATQTFNLTHGLELTWTN